MRTFKSDDSGREASRNYPNLAHQYGQIGISAVAAAVRYRDEDTRTTPQQRGYSDHED